MSDTPDMPIDLGYPSHDYLHDRPGYRGTSLQEFFALFPDNQSCLRHIFHRRFGVKPYCRKCDGEFADWRLLPNRKVFQHRCAFNLSPLGNTALSHTRVDLVLWFYAFLHIANSPESVSIKSLARHLGLEERVAFRMLHRMRLHIAALDSERVIGQPGEPLLIRLRKIKSVRTGKGMRNRVRYLVIGDRDQVTTFVVGQPNVARVRSFITRCRAPGSILLTDCPETFHLLSDRGYGRPLAQLEASAWKNNFDGQDTLQSFESYFHRPMKNQHNRVDMHKLWLYLKEYEFRYNRRYNSKSIFPDLVSDFPIVTGQRLEDLWAQNSAIRSLGLMQ